MSLDIGDATIRAAADARTALARSVAGAGERAMPALARQTIFAEALLGAIKARVAELKGVAK